MGKLLRFELHNMLSQKIVYCCIAIMFIFLTFLNYTSDDRMLYYQTIGYEIEDMIVGTLSNCFFTSFMAVILSFVACRDYEQNVIKNIYAKGYTFFEVYTAKFLFILILTAIISILTIFVGTIEASMVFGIQKTNILSIMIAQFIATLAYSAFGFMCCCWLKKSGFAVAFLLLIPPLGGLLLDAIDTMLPFDFSLGNFWITQTMAYIHGGTISTKEIIFSILTSGCYIIGGYFAGYKLIKK